MTAASRVTLKSTGRQTPSCRPTSALVSQFFVHDKKESKQSQLSQITFGSVGPASSVSEGAKK